MEAQAVTRTGVKTELGVRGRDKGRTGETNRLKRMRGPSQGSRADARRPHSPQEWGTEGSLSLHVPFRGRCAGRSQLWARARIGKAESSPAPPVSGVRVWGPRRNRAPNPLALLGLRLCA